MAAPCFDASVETLWPLLSPHAPSRGGSLALPSQGISSGSPGCFDALGTPCPQFIVQGFEVCTPRKPILGADEGQNVHPRPLLSCLGLLGRNWVLLEDPFLTNEEDHIKIFRNFLWHVFLIHSDTSFTPFLQKWRRVTPWWDTSQQTMT